MEHRCFRCKVLFPDTAFSPSRLRDKSYQCQPCVTKNAREHRRAHPENHRERHRRYYAAHREEINEKRKVYQAANRHKFRAHSTLRYAVRGGRIQRLPCEVCGKVKTDAHHADYSKPLDVHWLCKPHHQEAHGTTVESFCQAGIDSLPSPGTGPPDSSGHYGLGKADGV